MILIIFLVILVILLILAILFILYLHYSSPPITTVSSDEYSSDDEPNIPTIHSSCNISDDCGGSLVCDNSCNKCKNNNGNKCASDVDCLSGHFCQNWVCTPFSQSSTGGAPKINPKSRKSTDKSVKWNDSANQIIYF